MAPSPPTSAHGTPGAQPYIVRPVTLRYLSASEADALAVIAGKAVDCVVPAEAQRGWRMTLVAGRADAVRAGCDRIADLEWSGARLRIAYRGAAAQAWLACRLGVDDAQPLDEPLRGAALQAMLDDLLARLALSGLGTPILLDALADGTSRATHACLPHRFVLSMSAYGMPPELYAAPSILACIETDAFGLRLLAGLLAGLPARPIGIETDAIPLPVRLELPPVVLPAATVRALAKGDIVLLRDTVGNTGSHSAITHCAWAIAPGGRRWRMALQTAPAPDAIDDTDPRKPHIPHSQNGMPANAWQTSVMTTEDCVSINETDHVDPFAGGENDASAMSEARSATRASFASPSSESSAAAFFDALADTMPVRLTFELGEKHLSLAALRRWRVGEPVLFDPVDTHSEMSGTGSRESHLSGEADEAVVPIVPTRAPVRIRANGMLIAYGELVDIDGRLGVVIAGAATASMDTTVSAVSSVTAAPAQRPKGAP